MPSEGKEGDLKRRAEDTSVGGADKLQNAFFSVIHCDSHSPSILNDGIKDGEQAVENTAFVFILFFHSKMIISFPFEVQYV